MCVELIRKESAFSGEPCPPFYRPRGSRGYRWEKRGKYQRYRRSFEGAGSSFFLVPALLNTQAVSEVAYSLILVGHALASFSKWVRPILRRRTVRRTGEPSCDPSRSNRGSDHTSITVDDVISILDRSGCRMPVLVSVPED